MRLYTIDTRFEQIDSGFVMYDRFFCFLEHMVAPNIQFSLYETKLNKSWPVSS